MAMKIPRVRLVLIVSLLLTAGFAVLALNINPVLPIVILPLVALGSLLILSNPRQPESDWLRETNDELAGTIESTVLLIRHAKQSLKICVGTLNQAWFCDAKTIEALYQLPAGVTVEVITTDQDLTTIDPLLAMWIAEHDVNVTYRKDARQLTEQQFIIADNEHVMLEIQCPTTTSAGLTTAYFLTRKLGQWYAARFDRLKSATVLMPKAI